MPRPIRNVRQKGLAHRRRNNRPRHRMSGIPHLDVDDRPDGDTSAARQAQFWTIGDGRIGKTIPDDVVVRCWRGRIYLTSSRDWANVQAWTPLWLVLSIRISRQLQMRRQAKYRLRRRLTGAISAYSLTHARLNGASQCCLMFPLSTLAHSGRKPKARQAVAAEVGRAINESVSLSSQGMASIRNWSREVQRVSNAFFDLPEDEKRRCSSPLRM